MAAPKGNKNALGNSGGKKGRSGRKIKPVEIAELKKLQDMFSTPQDVQEWINKIEAGHYSPQDRWILKCLRGDHALEMLFNKIFPDTLLQNLKIKGELKVPLPLFDYVRNSKYNREDKKTQQEN